MKNTNKKIHDRGIPAIQPDFTYFSVLAAARNERAAYIGDVSARTTKWIGRKLIAPLAALRRRQRTYKELTALDDYSLADIGITRGDIPYLVKNSANQTESGSDSGAKAA